MPLDRAEARDVGDLICEQTNHLGIPLFAGTLLQDCNRFINGAALSIRSVVDKGVVGIADGHNPGEPWNRGLPQTVGVSVAVEVFVVCLLYTSPSPRD